MSLTEGIRGYGALLSRRDLRRMIAWGLVGRLPIGMTALALVLLVRGAGGSYAAAGAVTAVHSLAAAVGAPLGGRLVDRFRPSRVLAVYAAAQPAALTLLVVLAASGAPIWSLAVAAAASGAAFAPVGPTIRMLWPSLVPTAEQRSVAFAMEATLQEVIFVTGPLIVGVLAAVVSSQAGVVAAALFSLVGVLGFARSAPVRACPAAERQPGRHPLAALRPAQVRRLIAFAVAYGLTFGAVEVAIPAFAEEHGGRPLAGLVLAAWSGGSLAGGVLAAGLHGRDLGARLRRTSLAFAAMLVLPLLAGSIPVMAAVMFVVGMPIAPSFAVAYNLLERSAAPGTRAEAFGWVSTAITVGLAAGTAAGGSLISHVGIHASFVLGIAGAGAAAAIAATGSWPAGVSSGPEPAPLA